MQYRLSPFYFCVIATYGFTKEEERDIENQVVQNGECRKYLDSPVNLQKRSLLSNKYIFFQLRLVA
jgi:hypothetical protein